MELSKSDLVDEVAGKVVTLGQLSDRDDTILLKPVIYLIPDHVQIIPTMCQTNEKH